MTVLYGAVPVLSTRAGGLELQPVAVAVPPEPMVNTDHRPSVVEEQLGSNGGRAPGSCACHSGVATQFTLLPATAQTLWPGEENTAVPAAPSTSSARLSRPMVWFAHGGTSAERVPGSRVDDPASPLGRASAAGVPAVPLAARTTLTTMASSAAAPPITHPIRVRFGVAVGPDSGGSMTVGSGATVSGTVGSPTACRGGNSTDRGTSGAERTTVASMS